MVYQYENKASTQEHERSKELQPICDGRFSIPECFSWYRTFTTTVFEVLSYQVSVAVNNPDEWRFINEMSGENGQSYLQLGQFQGYRNPLVTRSPHSSHGEWFPLPVRIVASSGPVDATENGEPPGK